MSQAYDGPKSWSSKFTRIANFRADVQDKVVIQYIGDETAALVEIPHGNTKKPEKMTRSYKRTTPSVLAQIRSTNGTAQQVYQTLVTERACRIIQSGKIALDSRLAVFTVNGTNEPRLVRLFPNESCSCPAQKSCYHIMAAQMAVGIREDKPKRPLNLTTLRRNKRKRADKTSGRKHPRVDDVDVVAADDAEIVDAPRLTVSKRSKRTDKATAKTQPSTSDDVEPDDQHSDIRIDICHACDNEVPPARKRKVNKNADIMWVQCDVCPRWYHLSCLSMETVPHDYVCDMCNV